MQVWPAVLSLERPALPLQMSSLKVMVQNYFPGQVKYTKPAKKREYQLPSSQVSRFLAGIVFSFFKKQKATLVTMLILGSIGNFTNSSLVPPVENMWYHDTAGDQVIFFQGCIKYAWKSLFDYFLIYLTLFLAGGASDAPPKVKCL